MIGTIIGLTGSIFLILGIAYIIEPQDKNGNYIKYLKW